MCTFALATAVSEREREREGKIVSTNKWKSHRKRSANECEGKKERKKWAEKAHCCFMNACSFSPSAISIFSYRASVMLTILTISRKKRSTFSRELSLECCHLIPFHALWGGKREHERWERESGTYTRMRERESEWEYYYYTLYFFRTRSRRKQMMKKRQTRCIYMYNVRSIDLPFNLRNLFTVSLLSTILLYLLALHLSLLLVREHMRMSEQHTKKLLIMRNKKKLYILCILTYSLSLLGI